MFVEKSELINMTRACDKEKQLSPRQDSNPQVSNTSADSCSMQNACQT